MKSQTGFLLGIIIVLTAALAFVLGRQSMEPEPIRSLATDPEITNEDGSNATARNTLDNPITSPNTKENASSRDIQAVSSAKQYTEKFDDFTLTFLPTKQGKKLINFRIDSGSDSTCTKPYAAIEKVTNVTYSYRFVIERFNTWNEQEGQQEYVISEALLPNVWQGNLRDIVSKDRTVRVVKQRCGMGQVAWLVSVQP